MSTPLTIVGNLTSDPELRFTPSGAAVTNFTVASTPRTFDKRTNEWVDGETMFLGCSVWREAAENVAESLTKGTRVIVTGKLKARSYETKDGDKRTVFEVDVEEVGPALRYATARVEKKGRDGRGQSAGGQAPAGGGWGAAAGAPAAAPWGASTDDAPPF